MISRHWKGIARPGQAEAYVHHLKAETFPTLATIPGFVQALILERAVEAGTEFPIVTVLETLAAVEAFAGRDIEVAVVPPAVQGMMGSYEPTVRHYEVTEIYEPDRRG